MLCSTCISSVGASEFLPIVTGLVSYHSIKQNKAKQHTFRTAVPTGKEMPYRIIVAFTSKVEISNV